MIFLRSYEYIYYTYQVTKQGKKSFGRLEINAKILSINNLL